jgi:hypothetical protein
VRAARCDGDVEYDVDVDDVASIADVGIVLG